MAEQTPKRRRLRKPETVRQRTEKVQISQPEKPRRLRTATSVFGKRFRRAREVGGREYYLPLPDNKLGRFLNKRRRFVPRFIREAWSELKQVTWPNMKETFKLTFAVIMFATVFGLLIAVTDFGLEKLFKEVLLR